MEDWTPIEKEQPKRNGQYLVTGREYFIPDHRNSKGYRDGAVIFAYYSVETGWNTKVTAWMEKPKPYKKRRKLTKKAKVI